MVGDQIIIDRRNQTLKGGIHHLPFKIEYEGLAFVNACFESQSQFKKCSQKHKIGSH